MTKSAVQLTFPCPACGGFVTLRTFRAAGPCPACGSELEVQLSVRAIPEPGKVSADSGSGKRFAERRFRPVAHPSQPH